MDTNSSPILLRRGIEQLYEQEYCVNSQLDSSGKCNTNSKTDILTLCRADHASAVDLQRGINTTGVRRWRNVVPVFHH
jgi:hypothetical protein